MTPMDHPPGDEFSTLDLDQLRLRLRESQVRILELEATVGRLESSLCDKETQLAAASENVTQLNQRVTELTDLLNLFKPSSPTFLSDSKKVKFYTGFPSYDHFKRTLLYVNPQITHNNSALSNEMQFLLVMMKLRLNLRHQDLAYRFGISKTTASRYVLKWLDLMYRKLKPIIDRAWPTQDIVELNKAFGFQEFPRCIVIIDCFELPCARPKNLLKQASIFSNYKHTTTYKALVGITPWGVLSFVSQVFLGRVSDRHIVAVSGFIDKLKEGDQVMADKGFPVEELLAAAGATLVTPAFKRSAQLSHKEVEESREVSNVRIHVERAIGTFKNMFGILGSRMKPYTMSVDDDGVAFIEKVVTVCCALYNLAPPIVNH